MSLQASAAPASQTPSGLGSEKDVRMNSAISQDRTNPSAGEHGASSAYDLKTDPTVIHGAGTVSASSSSSSNRDDETTTAARTAEDLSSAAGLLHSSTLSSTAETADPPVDPHLVETAQIMIDFLQLTAPNHGSPPRKHQQQQQQPSGFDKPHRRPVTGMGGNGKQGVPSYGGVRRSGSPPGHMQGGVTPFSGDEDFDRRMHAPAFLFPSSRTAGGSPPPTTFRITIKEGGLVQHRRQDGRSHEEQRRLVQEEKGYRASGEEEEEERGGRRGDVAGPSSMASASEETEGLFSNEQSDNRQAGGMSGVMSGASGTLGDESVARNSSFASDTMDGYGRSTAHPTSAAAVGSGHGGLPLMPMKRYPFPDIRSIHTGTFRSPLGSSSEYQPDSHAIGGGGGGSSSINSGNTGSAYHNDPCAPFTMPSRADLSSSNMVGLLNATERGWERRDPNRVRRPPNVQPPSDAPPGRKGTTPPYNGSSHDGGMRRGSNVGHSGMMGPSGSLSSAEWEEAGSNAYPQHTYRKKSSGKNYPDGYRAGSGQGNRKMSGSSSSLMMYSSTSSMESYPSDHHSRNHHGGGPIANKKGAGQWDLFKSLLSQADEAEKELEHIERVEARNEDRKYNCAWYRIGYYRKCQEQYGDPRIYDSEDSEYEDPHEPDGWASYHDGLVPPPRDFDKVRDRMLQIDNLGKVQVQKATPKYTAKEWKTARRRETRQNKTKRDRYTNHYSYPPDMPPPPRKNQGSSKGGRACFPTHKVKTYKPTSSSASLRLPGQAPKRQSTALKDSYDVMMDGSIKCRRCNKCGFANELALRSHLSHCPGTIKMKEARMAKEMAQYAAAEAAAAAAATTGGEGGAPSSADIGKVTAKTAPYMPQATASPARQQQHHLGGSGHLDEADDTKLPSQPPAYTSSYHRSAYADSDRYSPPVMIMPQVDDGNPLVPDTIAGEDIIEKVISFHNRLVHGWTDVLVLNYRTRRNSHLVQYSDKTTEWVVLTDHNTCLEPGYRGSNQSGIGNNHGSSTSKSGGLGASISSSGSSRSNRNNHSHTDEELDHLEGSYTSKLGSSGSSSNQNLGGGGGAGSGDSSDDGQGGTKRRSSRFGEAGLASGGGGYETTASLGTNDFFKKQEELLTRRSNKRKSGDLSEGGHGSSGSLQDDQNSVSDVSEAGGPCKVVVRFEERMDADGNVRKVMKASPPHRSSHGHHTHPHSHYHPHSHHHQQPMVHHSPKKQNVSPYTGMTLSSNIKYSSGGGAAPQPAATSFPCRRCHMLFHNKQALGWHTRKGCTGPIPGSAHAGGSGASMAQHHHQVPQQQQHGGQFFGGSASSSSSGLQHGYASAPPTNAPPRTAMASFHQQQQHLQQQYNQQQQASSGPSSSNKRTYEDLAEEDDMEVDEEEHVANKKNRFN